MEIVIPTFALIIIGFVVYSAWVDKQRDEVEFKRKRLELHEWERTIKDKGWDEDYYEEELKWEAETGTSIEELEKELRLHKEEIELEAEAEMYAQEKAAQEEDAIKLSELERTIVDNGWDKDFYEKELKPYIDTYSIEDLEEELENNRIAWLEEYQSELDQLLAELDSPATIEGMKERQEKEKKVRDLQKRIEGKKKLKI